ncbi:MAG: serine hydrolase, partial [Clostridia bacterium]|nr:serine hydrolase [Clostridia bacterium]
YTTVSDMIKFWDHLFSFKLLSKSMTDRMLSVHAKGERLCYGYGVWIREREDGPSFYLLMGSDPGISFSSIADPHREFYTVIMSNEGQNIWKYNKDILGLFAQG